MNKVSLLSLTLILTGFFLFFMSAFTGNGGVALFLIFPIFYSTGWFGALGFIFIFFGFILLFMAPFLTLHNYSINRLHPKIQEGKVEKHYGGVILIGPIPIVFGSDKNYVLYSILGAILMIIAISLTFFIIYG